MKPSKPLLLFTRSCPREKLKIHGEQHRGWNRLVRDKKRKKEKNHEEKRGANGRRNEERKDSLRKKHIHFRVMFPVLSKWSAISGDRRKFNSVFILYLAKSVEIRDNFPAERKFQLIIKRSESFIKPVKIYDGK